MNVGSYVSTTIATTRGQISTSSKPEKLCRGKEEIITATNDGQLPICKDFDPSFIIFIVVCAVAIIIMSTCFKDGVQDG